MTDYSGQKTNNQHILPMFNLVLGFIILSGFFLFATQSRLIYVLETVFA